jgi:hypothetical protein
MKGWDHLSRTEISALTLLPEVGRYQYNIRSNGIYFCTQGTTIIDGLGHLINFSFKKETHCFSFTLNKYAPHAHFDDGNPRLKFKIRSALLIVLRVSPT